MAAAELSATSAMQANSPVSSDRRLLLGGARSEPRTANGSRHQNQPGGRPTWPASPLNVAAASRHFRIDVEDTGCGLSADTAAQLQAAVERARGRFSWADPRPHLARVSCPITLVHGADDDVIPVTHVHELRAALPADATAQTLITGLFGHTGSPGVRELLSRAPAAVQEAATLIRILRAIVDAATVGFRSARG